MASNYYQDGLPLDSILETNIFNDKYIFTMPATLYKGDTNKYMQALDRKVGNTLTYAPSVTLKYFVTGTALVGARKNYCTLPTTYMSGQGLNKEFSYVDFSNVNATYRIVDGDIYENDVKKFHYEGLIILELVAGGGGGSGPDVIYDSSGKQYGYGGGPGGGGGAYAMCAVMNTSVEYEIQLGAGGAGGAYSSAPNYIWGMTGDPGGNTEVYQVMGGLGNRLLLRLNGGGADGQNGAAGGTVQNDILAASYFQCLWSENGRSSGASNVGYIANNAFTNKVTAGNAGISFSAQTKTIFTDMNLSMPARSGGTGGTIGTQNNGGFGSGGSGGGASVLASGGNGGRHTGGWSGSASNGGNGTLGSGGGGGVAYVYYDSNGVRHPSCSSGGNGGNGLMRIWYSDGRSV